jgi:SAM-dependent methyltransferase
MSKEKFINYTNYTRAEDIKRLKFIQQHIQALDKKDLKVLDVGCGNGNISLQLGHNGFNVLGIDISEESIQNAKANNSLPNVVFRAIPVEELNTDEKYDAVVCSEVIEHLHAPDGVVVNLVNLLNPDGILIVTVPNGYGPRELFITKPMQWAMDKDGLWSFINRIKKLLGYSGTTIQSAAEDLTHVQFFTRKSLSKLMKNNGMVLYKFGVTNFLETVFPFSLLAKRSFKLQLFDCWVADRLPSSFSSGFMSIWKHPVNH